MYRKHFGLTRHPFAKNIEPDELFASTALSELEARLAHLLDLRGIGVVTGESGSGKTTACRKIVAGLHTLYKTIAWEIGLPTERNRAGLFRQIRNEVTRLCSEARQKPILIVDEAHHLRSDVLEDLRLLTNYAMDSDNRLCLVLVGHPELRRRLNMAVHEALSQRVVVRANVPGLARDEIGPYLEHLLRLAGTELALFEPATQEALFQASSGLPRKLNLLAHHSLMAAALARAKTVTTEHLQSAMAEVA